MRANSDKWKVAVGAHWGVCGLLGKMLLQWSLVGSGLRNKIRIPYVALQSHVIDDHWTIHHQSLKKLYSEFQWVHCQCPYYVRIQARR